MNLFDNIDGGSYQTQPLAWMDNILFDQWLRKPCTIGRDGDNRIRHLFMDNFSGHKHRENFNNPLLSVNREIEFLLRNSTH